MSEEAMSQEAFRAAKENGTLYYQPEDTQDEQYDDSDTVDDSPDESEHSDTYDADESEDVEHDKDDEEEDNLPELPEKQKTAFVKRMEAEDRKLRERLTAEYEAKYGQYKQVFEKHNLTPEILDAAYTRSHETNMLQNLVYNQGFSEDQARMYMDNQRAIIGQEIQKVSAQYPGMESMTPQITNMIQQNPSLNPVQAYFAVGGEALIEQRTREAAQRAIAQRTGSKRTVVSDFAEAPEVGPKGLMPEEARAAREMGISDKQARAMRDADFKDIKGYRAWVAKQKKAR
jgi:hypothetical protein